MDISKRNAMQIVNEISGIIGQHVNMMDADGTIIASTDPERMDTYHEGAARVIGEHLDELIIQSDDEYEGTRKGINLPILLDGEIAGVVGITGERDEVVKYGQIIKKMTEILLIENFDKEQKKIDDRIRTRFIDDWLYGDAISQGQAFIQRGARLGIDITLPRRVLVAEIENLRDYSDSPEGQRIIDRVNKTVRRMVGEEKNGVFAKTASQMICLMPDCEDAKLRFFAQQIQAQVWRQFSIRVIVGADSRDGSLLHQSYLRAHKALRACRASRGSTIRFYDDINLELFMDEIPQTSKAEFIRRIFRGFTPEEIDSWVHLLEVYFEADGSLSDAAAQLFIHKNTLQYKLRKLCEQTGYDPRSLSDSSLFYLAVQFYNENRDELNFV